MIKKSMLVTALFIAVQAVTAQNNITVEDIYTGQFRTEGLQTLRTMNSGSEYLVLNRSNNGVQSLDTYSYKTGEKTGTLLNSQTAGLPLGSYTLSDDESKMLIVTKSERIYRYSSYDKVYVYDLKTGTKELLRDDLVRSATFSPDGNKVGYVFENNLYYKDLKTGVTLQITSDGEKNKLINGVSDWVYEEEFAIVRAFQWSPDSQRMAFISFNEADVPEFSMDVYGANLYQKQEVFKYPKAGEKNAEVRLHVYDVNAQERNSIDLKRYKEFYIARINYAPNGTLTAQVLNRHQNELDFYMIDTNGDATIAFTEKDAAYVDVTDNLTFLDDSSFLWTSEKDNWNHIYHYDVTGKTVNQVTKGSWDVTSYYGYDKANKRIIFQSTEDGSVNRSVFSIDLDGTNKKRLSDEIGTNSASFSKDYSYFINTYSSASTPPVYTLHDGVTGKEERVIKTNSALSTKLKNYKLAVKEFSTIRINENNLNMWMMKPANYDANKEYPLLMFQYSGPGSQQVANRWYGANDYWHSMLANDGYIIVCVDGRGTGYKGADFKKATQKELGKLEVEDQIAVAKKLAQESFIDEKRIGIWGWSYGGFMSSNCILKGNDVFSTAIAVAPVTSWRFYDSIYTERYMTTPQENASGYDDNSPINHVDKLKGNYLLIHGTADDNVHVQNSMRMIEALVQANKQFDWAIYPDKNHGIYGGYTRIHLFNKMTDYIKENL